LFLMRSCKFRIADDPLSSYPLIAESAKIADDKSFIIFHLNPMACWQDDLQMRLKGIENDRYLNTTESCWTSSLIS
jgi:hypothetical protein